MDRNVNIITDLNGKQFVLINDIKKSINKTQNMDGIGTMSGLLCRYTMIYRGK